MKPKKVPQIKRNLSFFRRVLENINIVTCIDIIPLNGMLNLGAAQYKIKIHNLFAHDLRHNLGCKETDVSRIPSLLYMHKLSFPLIIMKGMTKSIREDRTILEGRGISAI